MARALVNFGFSRLALVAPSSWSGRPRTGRGETAREDVLARARRTARRGSGLLARAAVHPDLPSALAGCTWACGTTSRAVEGRGALDPHALGAEVRRRVAAGPVAVVFGEERRGLSNRELDLCQAVCSIPTAPEYDSMNLAQAAAVVAYEVARAAAPPPPAGTAPAEPARLATLEALWERLGDLLARAGYLNPQSPERILAEWRRLAARAEPSQREVEIVLAAVRALERALRRPAG